MNGAASGPAACAARSPGIFATAIPVILLETLLPDTRLVDTSGANMSA
jgi:hypothetical protein